MRILTLVENLYRRLFKHDVISTNAGSSEKFFGKHRGMVIENEDPHRLGRAKLRVPSVTGQEITGWAMPCVPYGGVSGEGMFMIPEVGANVWVEFEEGDISRPIWTGTFWQQGLEVPDSTGTHPPTTRLFRTRAGHALVFEDEDGNEHVQLLHSGGAELYMDTDGGVTLKDDNGNTLTMDSDGTRVEDASGSKVEMDSAGINIEASKVVIKGGEVQLGDENGEPLIKGTSFLDLFAKHIHTSAPVVGGPTSPPIPQGESSALSTTVKAI